MQAETGTQAPAQTLPQLAGAMGATVPCAGNLPLEMNDPQRSWFVERGAVEVFLLERTDGVESSLPQHVLHAGEGRLLFGVAPKEDDVLTLDLVAKGLPGTQLRELDSGELAALEPAELAAQADAWVADVATLLARDVEPTPRPDVLLDVGQRTRAGGPVGVRRGVVWVTGLSPGDASFMDLVDPGASASPTPLTPSIWLSLTSEADLGATSSECLARDGSLLPALQHFHDVALSLQMLNRRLAIVDLANLDRAERNSRRADGENARRRLFNLYGLRKAVGNDAGPAGLFAALRQVGTVEGIEFTFPARTEETRVANLVNEIADLSGVRARRVDLAGEERWWTGADSAMLAFHAEDGRPLALLPGRLGRFRVADPAAGDTNVVTATYAAALRPEAWVFYRPLPSGSVAARDLVRTGVGLSGDLARFLLAGFLMGLCTLVPAVFAGVIVDAALPADDLGLLYLATGALVVIALLHALLRIAQGMALMRLEARAIFRMEAAFWDRLLRLPLDFLRRYPAGDIVMRTMVFRVLRDNVLGVVASAVVSLVFVLPAFGLIFGYQEDSAVPVGAFTGGGIAVVVILGLLQMEPQSRAYAMMRRLSGLLLQFVKGIPRFRIGNAEDSAYAIWAREFLRQKQAELQVGYVGGHLQALQAAMPMLPGVVLMLAVPTSGEGRATVAGFIVIYLLYTAVMGAYGQVSAVFGQLSTLKPSMDLIRPFLTQVPEKTAEGQPTGELGGAVALDHVSFRYDADGPAILDDVSVEVHPGEFVAIAGESGSGKSTIFRLLLGLSRPDSGNVYYDGRGLQHLNIRQLRSQIGVVPQESRLYPQDIWDNIVGDQMDVTDAEVRRAMELADIAEEVDAMPMGPFTFVGADVVSGGESQRIRIARAVLRNPRIILLDEATNALSNDSQARIMQNLARLASTRIVIAHRLSTLREADRIYVLRAGKIAQRGTFDELMAVGGPFRDLARRQMA